MRDAARGATRVALALIVSILFAPGRLAAVGVSRAAGDISGTVTDSSSGQPLPSAEIAVADGGRIMANTLSDAFGRYTIHNIAPGRYTLSVRYVGFRPRTREITVGTGDLTGVNVALVPGPVSLTAVEVSATPIMVDTRTGDQVFKQDDYHGAPTHTTSQILQESIAGAARAPTGEVHIRGQHAEYTYYIDGVPVPAGISGSLNELFDPQVVDKINFQTGGWDAEYGNKNAAIVNVTTRIPAGGLHSDVGSYVGTYDTKSTVGSRGFNGQSLLMSTNTGPWGFFLSGERQFSDMRREPVVVDTASKHVMNFHNTGTDYFGFGKIQYTPSTSDVFALDLNASRTRFAVPYDSSGGTFSDDHQTDVNSFANLIWRHRFGETTTGKATSGSDFLGALFYRHGSLTYAPSASDDPQFLFFPDTLTAYNLSELRRFNTYGAKLDYTMHPDEAVEVKFGTQSSLTRGNENFSSSTASGAAGPASLSNLTGSDVGVYAQGAFTPTELFELRLGARYDAHTAPFAGTLHQVSPRVRLNIYPSPATTLYGYYGRLFMPTNVEDLRAITSAALGQAVTPQPTLPERDDFYELGLIQRLPGGVTAKVAGYYKASTPGIDDNTVPGSAITTSVNIDAVKITGVETVLELRPPGHFSGYVNGSINHAYGRGPITGGFFPTDTPNGFFDLDHDQRVAIVATGTYTAGRAFLSATENYGSGLTNGVDPADCNCTYGTGLLDFNRGIKVNANAITNLSAGYTWLTGNNTTIRPQIFIENLFNKSYLLKGAFFSGASAGRPRSIQIRLNVGM